MNAYISKLILWHLSTSSTTVFNLKPRVNNKKAPRKIFVYSKGDMEGIRTDILNFHENFLSDGPNHSSDDNWVLLKDFILQTMDRNIPSKFSRSRANQPWISPSLKRMVRKKARLYNEAKETNAVSDWNNFKSFRKTVQKKIRAAYWSYTKRMLTDS